MGTLQPVLSEHGRNAANLTLRGLLFLEKHEQNEIKLSFNIFIPLFCHSQKKDDGKTGFTAYKIPTCIYILCIVSFFKHASLITRAATTQH